MSYIFGRTKILNINFFYNRLYNYMEKIKKELHLKSDDVKAEVLYVKDDVRRMRLRMLWFRPSVASQQQGPLTRPLVWSSPRARHCVSSRTSLSC